jgi:hypothetical protein
MQSFPRSRSRFRRVLATVCLLGFLGLPLACKHGGDSNGGSDGGTRTGSSGPLHVVN